LAFGLWASGVLVYPLTLRRARSRSAPLPLNTLLGFVTILMLAAALRFIAVGDIPVNMHNDEIAPVLESRRIARGLAPNVFSTVGWYNTPNFAFTFVALMLMLLPQDPIFAARLCTAFLGMGGITFTFLLARRLFAHRVALIAIFLMAVSLWHVGDSRSALTFVQSSFCTSLVLYLVVRGQQDRSRTVLAFAGICAGLAAECYFPSRIVLLLCPGYLLMHWMQNRVPLRSAIADALAFGIAAVLVLAPLLASIQWGIIVERSQQVLVTDPRARANFERLYQVSGVLPVFLRNIGQTLSMFTDWAHLAASGPSKVGLLDVGTLTALVVGGVVALLGGEPDRLFVLVWLLFTMLVGVAFTDDPRAAYRLAAAMPAVFMLAGLGLEHLLQFQRRQRYQRVVRPAVICSAAMLIFIPNYRALFATPSEHYESVALRLVGSHCDGRKFYFVGNWYGPGPPPSREPPHLELFCQDYIALAPDQIPQGVDTGRGAMFLVISWADHHALEVLRSCYPSAEVTPHKSTDGRLLFTAVDAPIESVQNAGSCPTQQVTS